MSVSGDMILDPRDPMPPSPQCGRIDDHDAHEWIGHDHASLGATRRVVRECPGNPLIEGGHGGVL